MFNLVSIRHKSDSPAGGSTSNWFDRWGGERRLIRSIGWKGMIGKSSGSSVSAGGPCL